MTIIIGDSLPAIGLDATSQQHIMLSDCVGKNVILYFYPKDHTSGCIQEGQDFRDHYAEFSALNAVIFGVSRDTVRTHENFKRKQALPFELLSDGDEVLCSAFDIVKPKTMFGKPVRGIVRSTFLFDAQGILRQEWRKVKVLGHVDEVLQSLKDL